MTRLQVIGGGRMGEALVGGLLASGWCDARALRIVERLPDRRADLIARFPGVDVSDELSECEGALIAVKPHDVESVCAEIVSAGAGRALSIAAGVTIARLEAALGDTIPVVRAMPNTPALVGAGASAIARGTTATDDDLEWADEILSAVGLVVRVDESLLDAVTGLSGSGPAYLFLVAEAMIEAGVIVGLSSEVSHTLAIQTLLGAARMLAETGESPAQLRAAVTSPGGTTVAGLGVLEEASVRDAFIQAIAAATRRSREIGQS